MLVYIDACHMLMPFFCIFSVLSRVGNRCALENNSLLHIDLSTLDQGTNLGYRGGDGHSIPSWILIAAIAGGVCLLVLIIALTLVACRLQGSHHSQTEKQYPHLDPSRIRVDKHGPPGTDV